MSVATVNCPWVLVCSLAGVQSLALTVVLVLLEELDPHPASNATASAAASTRAIGGRANTGISSADERENPSCRGLRVFFEFSGLWAGYFWYLRFIGRTSGVRPCIAA